VIVDGVRLCIEDEECRAVFAHDDAIRDRWRVPGSGEVENGPALPKPSKIPRDPAASRTAQLAKVSVRGQPSSGERGHGLRRSLPCEGAGSLVARWPVAVPAP
jgi:hypothetical protein